MADAYLRRSPLAHLRLQARAVDSRGAAGVAMGELDARAIIELRGNPKDKGFTPAFRRAFGFALPVEPNSSAGKDGSTALWLGPDTWWLVTAAREGPDVAARLRAALAGHHVAITEIGDSRCCVRVAGPRARDLLGKATPLDLHPRMCATGDCRRGHLAKAAVTLHQVSDEPAYDLYVLRSFSEYLWLWLEDAAQEYGVVVMAGQGSGQ